MDWFLEPFALGFQQRALLGGLIAAVMASMVGVWLVLLPFPHPSFFMVLAAFVLFRIFDIAKPWPVKASECWLPAGYGVMIDDVVAGLWALLCLSVLAWMGLS